MLDMVPTISNEKQKLSSSVFPGNDLGLHCATCTLHVPQLISGTFTKLLLIVRIHICYCSLSNNLHQNVAKLPGRKSRGFFQCWIYVSCREGCLGWEWEASSYSGGMELPPHSWRPSPQTSCSQPRPETMSTRAWEEINMPRCFLIFRNWLDFRYLCFYLCPKIYFLNVTWFYLHNSVEGLLHQNISWKEDNSDF